MPCSPAVPRYDVPAAGAPRRGTTAQRFDHRLGISAGVRKRRTARGEETRREREREKEREKEKGQGGGEESREQRAEIRELRAES